MFQQGDYQERSSKAEDVCMSFLEWGKGQTLNESLTQKIVVSMEEVMMHVECYTKGKKNNVEKKARDIRDRASSHSDSSQEALHIAYQRQGRPVKNFTSLCWNKIGLYHIFWALMITKYLKNHWIY